MDKRTIKSRQGLIVKYISLKALLWALLSYLSNHFLHPGSPTGLVKRPNQPQELYLPTCQPSSTAPKMIFSDSSSACWANGLARVPWSPSWELMRSATVTAASAKVHQLTTRCPKGARLNRLPVSTEQRVEGKVKEAWKKSLKSLQWAGGRQLLSRLLRQTQEEEFLRSGHSQETEDGDYPPFLSTHLEYCVLFCHPKTRTSSISCSSVSRKPWGWSVLEHLSCAGRLRNGACSPWRRPSFRGT